MKGLLIEERRAFFKGTSELAVASPGFQNSAKV
jgi:hypothetical protein